MNRTKSFYLSLIFLLISVTAFSSVEQVTIANANKAYSNGAYTEAAELYQKVINQGLCSADLYYNLGNTYFKMNDFAKAILFYERAKRLDPGNEDIEFNLNVANTKISDKIEPLPEMFYKRWFSGLVQLFTPDGWAVFSIIMFISCLAGFILYLVSHVLVLRKVGFWYAISSFIIFLFVMIFAWSGYQMTTSAHDAIIFAPTITVKSSPDEKSTDLFVLHEGAKVKLLDQISGWYEIKLANGSVGWLPIASLEKI